MNSKVLLGSIATIQAGPFGTQLHKNEYVATGVPMLNAKNVGNGVVLMDDVDCVMPATCDRLPNYVLKYGDILFGRAGSIDRHCFISNQYDGCFQGTNCIRVRCHDVSLAKYISYYLWLPHVKKSLEAKTGGSVLSYITTDLLSTIEIEFPEGSVSDIESILTSIDNKIANNNAICSNLEAMAKLLYDYWFVQFDFPDENGKPYKSSGGKMVWNDVLKREIPAGWKAGEFGDCITSINTGLNPRDNFKLNTDGNIRYLTVKNLTKDGMIDFSSCDLIDEDAKKIIHRRSDICIGDVLFASISPLGRCCIITDKPEDWDINESVFSIRPNYKNMTSIFLYMTFMSKAFVKKAEGSSTGSVFKGIRIAELQALKTIIPPLEVLKKFDKKVQGLFSTKANAFTENQQLASLRDFLLPMLMNGQVTVRDNR